MKSQDLLGLDRDVEGLDVTHELPMFGVVEIDERGIDVADAKTCTVFRFDDQTGVRRSREDSERGNGTTVLRTIQSGVLGLFLGLGLLDGDFHGIGFEKVEGSPLTRSPSVESGSDGGEHLLRTTLGTTLGGHLGHDLDDAVLDTLLDTLVDGDVGHLAGLQVAEVTDGERRGGEGELETVGDAGLGGLHDVMGLNVELTLNVNECGGFLSKVK